MNTYRLLPVEAEKTKNPEAYKAFIESPMNFRFEALNSDGIRTNYDCGVLLSNTPDTIACLKFLQEKFGMEFGVEIGNFNKCNVGRFNKTTNTYTPGRKAPWQR